MKPFKAKLTELDNSISPGLTVNKVYSFNETGRFKDEDGDLRPLISQKFDTQDEVLNWWRTSPCIAKFEPITEHDTLTKEEIRDIIREEIKSYDHDRTISEHEQRKSDVFKAMQSDNFYTVDTDSVKRAVNLMYGTLSDIRKDLELMIARFEDQTDCHLAGVKTRSMSSIALQSKTAQLISINISETNKSVRTRIISESRGFYTIGIAYDSTLSEIETKIKAIIEYIGELLND